jgi:hypothetical protein
MSDPGPLVISGGHMQVFYPIWNEDFRQDLHYQIYSNIYICISVPSHPILPLNIRYFIRIMSLSFVKNLREKKVVYFFNILRLSFIGTHHHLRHADMQKVNNLPTADSQ